MFLRTHMMEDAAGKLSEKYEFSPRFVLGYETPCGVGARVRYWTYARTTDVLSEPGNIHFEFNVLDVEATSRFKSGRSELVVGGGFRFASIENEWDEEGERRHARHHRGGRSPHADLRQCGKEWAAVCGARWSVLGGDWDGSDDGFVGLAGRQHRGAGSVRRCRVFGSHLHLRDVHGLVFEMQNWHSDVMSQTVGRRLDQAFLGPGIHAGNGLLGLPPTVNPGLVKRTSRRGTWRFLRGLRSIDTR